MTGGTLRHEDRAGDSGTEQPAPAGHTEKPAPPAPAGHTEKPAPPAPAGHTEKPAPPAPAGHTEKPAPPAPPAATVPPAPPAALVAALERGRDLLLLATGLIVLIEASFAVWGAVAADQFVLRAGRLALVSGLSYMSFQGVVVSRWLLVALAGVAALGGPIAIHTALTAGNVVEAVLMGLAAMGYAVAALLLALSRDVRAFATARARTRDQDRDALR
jgi:hypothetical protein